MLASRTTKHAGVWHANNIDDQLDLLTLIGTWEQWEAREELNHDATEGPHVDLLRIREHSKHDIWRPVEPTLDISVHYFVLQTATAEIGDGDPTFILLLHENILRFQVAVNDTKVLQVAQTRKQLNCETSYQPVLKALVVIHLDELVKVNSV